MMLTGEIRSTHRETRSSAALSTTYLTWAGRGARLDGASFRASAHATLHPLTHASWRKSRASLAACLILFRRY